MKSLPDYINKDVRVLFVGINPGLRSAALGHHFAGYSNRFWKLLNESKLVPVPLTYHEDSRLPEWELGLTNIVSRPTSGSHSLSPKDYQIGRAGLAAKIRKHRISIIALLGITLLPVLFPESPRSGSRSIAPSSRPKLGFQLHHFAGARVFLLPNPSGRNAHYSYAEMLKYFKKLAKIIREQKSEKNVSKNS